MLVAICPLPVGHRNQLTTTDRPDHPARPVPPTDLLLIGTSNCEPTNQYLRRAVRRGLSQRLWRLARRHHQVMELFGRRFRERRSSNSTRNTQHSRTRQNRPIRRPKQSRPLATAMASTEPFVARGKYCHELPMQTEMRRDSLSASPSCRLFPRKGCSDGCSSKAKVRWRARDLVQPRAHTHARTRLCSHTPDSGFI